MVGELHVRSTLVDDAGHRWHGRCRLLADSAGECWLSDAPAEPVTPSPHGSSDIFWRLYREDCPATQEPVADDALAPAIAPLECLDYALHATDGAGERHGIVKRDRLPEGVQVERALPNGLRGALFTGGQNPRGVVLVLGGSEGGIAADRAAALAGCGYAALALGYFAFEDRPAVAERLPLEYFRDGLDFLRRRWPALPITVWGGSRGSEAAMLCSIHFPELVEGVIAWVPSHVVNPGFDMAGGEDFTVSSRPMWTLASEALPDCGRLAADEAMHAARAASSAAAPGYRYAGEFLRVWQRVGADHPCRIAIERARAKVLFVTAADDGLWPSAFAGEALAQRLRDAGERFTHCVLPDCGHAIGMPHEPRPFSHTSYWAPGYAGGKGAWVNQGGNPRSNACGAVRAWHTVLKFLDTVRAPRRVDPE